MRQKYFSTPTQVTFRDPYDEDTYLCGIAYQDIIICSCCGGIYEIDEICNINADDAQPYYIAQTWMDLSSELEENKYKGLNA